MLNRFDTLREEGSVARAVGSDYDDWSPDIVVVSGDIGYSGSHEDYLLADEFFKDLLSRLDLPPDRVVMCPGNHDRDWRRVTHPIDEAGKARYPGDPKESDELLSVNALTLPAPDGGMNQMVAPFFEFTTFCKNFGSMCPTGIPGLEYLTGRCRVEVKNLSIEFLVVNSAWLSAPKHQGGDDQQQLWLGLPLLEQLEIVAGGELMRLNPDCLHIGVCHHPLNWLNPAEFYGVEDRPPTYRNLAENCHALLSGHVHSPLEPPSLMYNHAQVFTGGAVYTREDHIVSSNLSLLKFDLDDHSVGRRGFELRPEHNAWEEKQLSSGTYHLHNNDAPQPPVADGASLEGPWESVVWQELKPSVTKRVTAIDLHISKKRRNGVLEYRSAESDEVRIRGELKDGYFSGYWRDDGAERHGTFQVKVRDASNLLIGRWVGFDAETRIQAGYWKFRRLP
jgi:hypothetical protein